MTRTLAIIDYGSGNLRSVAKAFERMAAPDDRILVSHHPADLNDATHIVLPGVGAFADCMTGLAACSGMRGALEKQVLEAKKPFLGICVGMQLLFTQGHEHGVHDGLNWIPGQVVALAPANPALKVPHMGWNELSIRMPHPLLAGVHTGDHAYFVHSYHAVCDHAQDIVATTDYGGAVTAVVARGNIMGTQFHPEKSQKAGLQLLENFLALRA